MSRAVSIPGTGMTAKKRNTKKIPITKRILFRIDFSVMIVPNFLNREFIPLEAGRGQKPANACIIY